MMFEKMDKQSRAIEKEKEQKETKMNKNVSRSPKPVTPQKIENKLEIIAGSQIFSDSISNRSLS